jgi:predicted metal-binding membrane protein
VYLLVWLGVGVPVYVGSVGVAALGEGGSAWLPYALAVVLASAGAYQFTAIKRVCLKNCQSPMGFMMERWRASYGATLRLALTHAAYCVGCCWGLMVILVAAGAMSLPWVLLIAAVVFAEKLLPRGEWTAREWGWR